MFDECVLGTHTKECRKTRAGLYPYYCYYCALPHRLTLVVITDHSHHPSTISSKSCSRCCPILYTVCPERRSSFSRCRPRCRWLIFKIIIAKIEKSDGVLLLQSRTAAFQICLSRYEGALGLRQQLLYKAYGVHMTHSGPPGTGAFCITLVFEQPHQQHCSPSPVFHSLYYSLPLHGVHKKRKKKKSQLVSE